MSKRGFVLAGEASGDFHGARLIGALKRLHPKLHFFGVPGPRLREQGVEPLLCTEELQIMGFTDVVRNLPRMRRQFHHLVDIILRRQPELVLLIDYAGLNLRLARALRKKGFTNKIVQYISPKVWAWGKGRIPKMAETLDIVLAIFPFEPAVYAGYPLRVEYIGNPLTEEIAEYSYQPNWAMQKGLSPQDPIVGLLPGSRISEIKHNLPYLLKAAVLLHKRHPQVQFGLSVANQTVAPLIQQALQEAGVTMTLVPSHERYDLMKASSAAIAASGTVNLELALHKVPTTVIYQISHLNALIARLIFRINLEHYSIANIVAGKELFPEKIYVQCRPKPIAEATETLLFDPTRRERCLAICHEVCDALVSNCPSEKGAQLLLDLMG